MENLTKAGFTAMPENQGRVRVSKHGCAAMIQDGGGSPAIEKAGVVVSGEIALPLNCGYQMFLETPAGRREPAQAAQLQALHAFEEDLREELGLKSLYNTSLGTVSQRHRYDRVEDRDGVGW